MTAKGFELSPPSHDGGNARLSLPVIGADNRVDAEALAERLRVEVPRGIEIA